jgi:hypothetical protein
MIHKTLISIIFLCVLVFPQTKDTLYYLTVDIGAGYSRYITTLDDENLDQNGYGGTIRIMWHPEHLLSLGFESGYQYLYRLGGQVKLAEAGISDVRASMVSIPIMVIFSMKIFPEHLSNLEIKSGLGVFLLYNRGSAFGASIKNSQISIGYSAAVTYLQPISDVLLIGGEINYLNISKIQDSAILFQLMLSYKFLQW